MTAASRIVNHLLEGEADEFMSNYQGTWHIKVIDTRGDNNGAIQWYRGVEPLGRVIYGFQLQLKDWYEKYVNWLDKVYPYDAFSKGLDWRGKLPITDWLAGARQEGFLRQYRSTPGSEVPDSVMLRAF